MKFALLLLLALVLSAGCAAPSATSEKTPKVGYPGTVTLPNGRMLKLRNHVVPAYPSDLRKKNVMGKVSVRFRMLPNGKVGEVQIYEWSHPGFVLPVFAAIRQWEFEVPRGDVVPPNYYFELPIEFVLE